MDDGGIRGLKSDQLSLDINRLTKEKRMAECDLALSVKQAFIETLRARQEIGLEEESIRQLGVYFKIVRRLSSAGQLVAYTDVLKTQLQLSNAQLLVWRSGSREFSVAKYALAELIGGIAGYCHSPLPVL